MDKKYSLLGNIYYTFKYAIKRQKGFIPTLVVSGITWASYPIIFAYMPKIVLDMITNKVDISRIIWVMIALSLLLITLSLVDGYVAKSQAWRFKHMLMGWREKRMKKTFSMDFKNLENPDVLNLMERAAYVTNSEHDGIGALYNDFTCFCRNGLTIIVTLFTIATLNPWIVLIIFVCCFGEYKVLDITKQHNKKKYMDVMPPYWRKLSYLNTITNDFEYGKDIRLFKMRPFINNKTKEVNDGAHIISKQMFNRWILCKTGMSFFELIQFLVLYGWIAYGCINKSITVGNAVLYIGVATAFSENVVQVFDVIADIKRANLEVCDYRRFMDYPNDEYDNSIGEKIEELDFEKFEFEFQNVSFKYPGQERYALENINIIVRAGERLAVVGMNGAGKSTFIKLILRLYEPTSGSILLNGIDIKRFDRKKYYEAFAPAFQNVECFAMPVKQNISMKKKLDTDDELVKKCIDKAGLDKKIRDLDNGIDTEMLKIFYSDGIDLSGGEKQKLTLARALYKSARVIILDEPTAALDALAEDRMYKQFDKLIKGRTAIYISHRLASTRFCDNIAIFVDGHIEGMGTHDEMMVSNRIYREMFDMQAQYYKEQKEEEITKDKNCDNGAFKEETFNE